MKRILLPAGGAILATGLLAAGLAGTAQADNHVSDDALAATTAQAQDVVDYWSHSNYAALRGATAFNPDSLEVTKISRGGGYSPDTKPGSTSFAAPKTPKSTNVNFPKTIGKVFFQLADGKNYWCSGTSVQSGFKNLVATAGHCVYDISGNKETVSKWVFVPGYYQGKVPFGLYVGKQAFTHYDFDVYEDFDRDYAFVTVYNGIGGTINQPTSVSKKEYDAYEGRKFVKDSEVSQAEYIKGKADPTTTDYYDVDPGVNAEKTGPDYPGAVVEKVETTKTKWTSGGVGKGNGFKFGLPITEQVTKAEFDKFEGEKLKDAAGNYTITHYYIQQWWKPGKVERYIHLEFFIVGSVLKDVGTLGDNVGAQGVAWNQPSGKYVRTFGYPFGPHPDGSKPYTGVTPKWCYGKTEKNVIKVPTRKVEEQQSFRCPVTAGYDGGPWLYKYSNAKRLGFVDGVTSLTLDTDKNGRYDTITTAYFDGETAAIYTAATKAWSGKLVK